MLLTKIRRLTQEIKTFEESIDDLYEEKHNLIQEYKGSKSKVVWCYDVDLAFPNAYLQIVFCEDSNFIKNLEFSLDVDYFKYDKIEYYDGNGRQLQTLDEIFITSWEEEQITKNGRVRLFNQLDFPVTTKTGKINLLNLINEKRNHD